MGEPRLSIVTITYNDEVGLAETVGSLRPLLGRDDWEHVIVDSSPERNARVLEGLRRDGWPLVHLTTKPEGVYAAQNAGLARARGRAVWFLNGGDTLLSAETLEAALIELESNGTPALVCCQAELRRDGKALYVQKPSPRLLGNVVGLNRVCHQAIIYSRGALERLGPFSPRYKIAADYEHHWKAYAAGLSWRLVPSPLVAYDMSGRSADYDQAFAEFRDVQRAMARELPAWVALANEVVRPLEHARVAAFKKLGKSPLGDWLRPIWHAIKRR